MLRGMRILALAPLAPPAVALARRPPAPKLDPTLDAHLAAIAARDLPALLATVAEDVTLILPGGQLLDGKAAYRKFHEEWFAEKGWTMGIKELRRDVGDGHAVVLVQTDYRDKDDKGAEIRAQSYLVLVWKRVGARWLLVHDQNTRLPAS